MIRLMHDYEVSCYGYFVVAIDKRNKDDVEDMAFHAVSKLYKNDSDVKVIDIETGDSKTDEFFTFVNVKLDLRVKVSGGYDYEECFPEAEGLVTENVDTPVGVSLIECQAYEYIETDTYEAWDE